jgi:hypothetical protein
MGGQRLTIVASLARVQAVTSIARRFLINGTPREWSNQADGPALQTLAILALYGQLDAPTQASANTLIAANLNFLQQAYQGQATNLWEEEYGASFFARSVQLAGLQAVSANSIGIARIPAVIRVIEEPFGRMTRGTREGNSRRIGPSRQRSSSRTAWCALPVRQ